MRAPIELGARVNFAAVMGACIAISAVCGLVAARATPSTVSAANLSGTSAARARGSGSRGLPSTKGGALAGETVGIDPGHNGHNYLHPEVIDRKIWNGREWENCNTTGTETDGGYTEAKFNFRVAMFLRKDLIHRGADVVLTRHNNHGVGPCVNKRAEVINHAHADVGIDIHADGGPASGRGFAILEPVKDKQNRHVITSSAQFGSILRHAVLTGTAMPTSTYDGNSGINHRDDLAGLNLTRVPLVLIECGNMRNATDARLLASRHFQTQLARAFATAITTFLRRHS